MNAKINILPNQMNLALATITHVYGPRSIGENANTGAWLIETISALWPDNKYNPYQHSSP
jgi:hypothetical protein